ncbi:MAG: hypothetical protein NUW37_08580 [Planctomycetes bacterium]|nr:hypothetical protein [Planctomycetota bacterium]
MTFEEQRDRVRDEHEVRRAIPVESEEPKRAIPVADEFGAKQNADEGFEDEQDEAEESHGSGRKEQPKADQFPCKSCGADLKFTPGSQTLSCPYCGAENEIEVKDEDIDEFDYLTFLEELDTKTPRKEIVTIHCETCGAESTLDENITADKCPFCGSAVVAAGKTSQAIEPLSLLPFAIEKKAAQDKFKIWISGLWFAPSGLKKYARTGLVDGMYVPYYTYDADTKSNYHGQRGIDYWDTETYTTTVNGKSETRTRQVRRTRWYPVSGTVYVDFDDVLVLGSRSLPKKYADELEPWDIESLVPMDQKFISGFRAECASVNLKEGFGDAKDKMEPTIRSAICRDIGGDHQQISSMKTYYRDIYFKHVLLPAWISSYRFKEKTYRFLVNGRTGEVQGERPWSIWKITLAILSVLAVIAAILLLTQ